VFVGKRFSTSRAASEVEVSIGVCLSSVDCGASVSVDVISRNIDFPSSSYRRCFCFSISSPSLAPERLIQITFSRLLPTAVSVSSPLLNVMLNADSLVAVPVLLLLQVRCMQANTQ
jgi:hypothetical protein